MVEAKETAAKALLLYNTTGERRPSDVIFRRIGTIKERNGRFRGVYKNLSVGTFATEELAQAALDKRIEQVANGIVFVSKKKESMKLSRSKKMVDSQVNLKKICRHLRFQVGSRGGNKKIYPRSL